MGAGNYRPEKAYVIHIDYLEYIDKEIRWAKEEYSDEEFEDYFGSSKDEIDSATDIESEYPYEILYERIEDLILDVIDGTTQEGTKASFIVEDEHLQRNLIYRGESENLIFGWIDNCEYHLLLIPKPNKKNGNPSKEGKEECKKVIKALLKAGYSLYAPSSAWTSYKIESPNDLI